MLCLCPGDESKGTHGDAILDAKWPDFLFQLMKVLEYRLASLVLLHEDDGFERSNALI